ncbi:Oxysterol-binding protein-domain-containing protein [Lipomyces japonicus]|uniref:Oxysterol-binding protein-domain-containing protein n=1 Tax=Lipomyces japonicus TaxID=56871 RepID=UPI0034CD3A9E
MDTLSVHSKAFLIKWISVPDNSSIRWQLKPNKKSINFGIFKRVENKTHVQSSSSTNRVRSASVSTLAPSSTNNVNVTVGSGSLNDKLTHSGLSPVYLHGKCQSGTMLKGSFYVDIGSGGIFAFVFDNTFSKTISKTVQFAHSIQSTKTSHELSTTVTTTQNAHSRRRKSMALSSNSKSGLSAVAADAKRDDLDDYFFQGVLLKKRRKKLQGYARRYFKLDSNAGMLSYYHDASSSVLRGSIPLAIAAISVKLQTREIYIDSGAEIWNLRATSQDDFDQWRAALEKSRSRALNFANHEELPSSSLPPLSEESPSGLTPSNTFSLHDRNSSRLNDIGQKLREALALSKSVVDEANAKNVLQVLDDRINRFSIDFSYHHKRASSPSLSGVQSTSSQPSSSASTVSAKRQPFWRKKSKDNNTPTLANGHVLPAIVTPSDHLPSSLATPSASSSEELYKLLEHINLEYFSLLASNHAKKRSFGGLIARKSFDGMSVTSESEFFDAEEDPGIIVLADHDDAVEDIVVVSDDEDDDDDRSSSSIQRSISSSSSSSSNADESDLESEAILEKRLTLTPQPTKVRDLSPLPINTTVKRRITIPENKLLPPSMIQLIRKNVGKDLTSVTMPVTANEPLSILQRYSESLESAALLERAETASIESGEQILYIASFVIATLSNNRFNVRAIRKPFNPLHHETFELVREDLNFRLISEKISHRPPIMALYAESNHWSYSYCPQPSQKFWGKSAEIISEGPITITISSPDGITTSYGYTLPTTYLRNMIAGEKYIEPSGQTTIVSSSGHKAVIEFKSPSLFSGKRSEEVTVKVYHNNAVLEGISLEGKWTTELIRTSDGSQIWKVGDLVSDPKSHYGFTTFAASLNQITEIEKGSVAPTDSRLRPDQRALENCHVEKAEDLKKKVEEMQRDRRKSGQLVSDGVSSLWFEQIGQGVWVPRQGENSYWERRKRNDWSGLPKLW